MNMILHDNPTALDRAGQHADRARSSRTATRSRPSTTSSPIRRSRTSAGATASIRATIRTSASSLRHAARQAGRLCLPAAHRPVAQEHRQGRVHPAARRAVPRQRRGRHPPRRSSAAATSRASSACPPNLFYGTGIPACIVVLDKEDAAGAQGHLHDRRQQGLHEGRPQEPPARAGHPQDRGCLQPSSSRSPATRAWSRSRRSRRTTSTSTSRATSTARQPEDLQDIDGHLHGGIPERDVDALGRYWEVCPELRQTLFKPNRPGYVDLAVEKAAIKSTIYEHPEFAAFIAGMNEPLRRVAEGKRGDAQGAASRLPSEGGHRRARRRPARPTTRQAADRPLRRLPAPDGLLGGDDAGRLLPDRRRRLEGRDLPRHREGQEGQGEGQGLDLRPGPQGAIVARYFAKEQAAIDQLAADWKASPPALPSLEEEHGGEEGAFAELDKVNKANVTAGSRRSRATRTPRTKPPC